MPRYRYRGHNQNDEPVEGVIEAASAYDVTNQLDEQGIRTSDVEEIHRSSGFSRRSTPLTWDDLSLFCRQLVALTESGLPLSPSLESMASDVAGRRLREVLLEVKAELDRGETLEKAIERRKESFPPMFVAAVRAGERSGNLPAVLRLLASDVARFASLRQDTYATLFYPLLVFIVTIGLLSFLSIKVAPTFEETFNEFGSAMPLPTVYLLDVSNFFLHHWWQVFVGMALAGMAAHLLARALGHSSFPMMCATLLRPVLPALGLPVQRAALARFSRSLGVLLASRVPVKEAVQLAGLQTSYKPVRRGAQRAGTLIESGKSLSEALAESKGFERTFCWLVGSGEQQGDVESVLLHAADAYDRQVALADRTFLQLLGPVSIFIIGALVAAFVIALYLPLFTLGDAISG